MRKEITKPSIEGLFCIDKPDGISSFKVVDKVRKYLKIQKVGHTGTLDKMVTGVLVICLGKATRVVEYLQVGTKIYEATIHLGISTDTDDAEGIILNKVIVDNITLDKVRDVMKIFTGKILQKPPLYSAIKKSGVRLYKLARAGTHVEIEPREVEIYNIEIKKFCLPFLEITAEVSPGTYIRSLARDIGNTLSCGAHISQLRRIKDGNITINMCTKLDELLKMNLEKVIKSRSFIPMNEALSDIPTINIDEAGMKQIKNGISVEILDETISEGLFQVKYEGTLVAVGRLKDGIFKPNKVLM